MGRGGRGGGEGCWGTDGAHLPKRGPFQAEEKKCQCRGCIWKSRKKACARGQQHVHLSRLVQGLFALSRALWGLSLCSPSASFPRAEHHGSWPGSCRASLSCSECLAGAGARPHGSQGRAKRACLSRGPSPMGLSSGRGQQGQRARLHGDRIRAKGACRSAGPGPMAACSRERGPARPSCPNQGREALRDRAVGQAPWWSKALRHQNQYSGALQGHMADLHGAALRAEGPCNSRGPGPVARK